MCVIGGHGCNLYATLGQVMTQRGIKMTYRWWFTVHCVNVTSCKVLMSRAVKSSCVGHACIQRMFEHLTVSCSVIGSLHDSQGP